MSDSETDSETDNKHTIALDATAVADMHDEVRHASQPRQWQCQCQRR